MSGNAQENRHPTRLVLADQVQNHPFLRLTSNFVVPNIFLCRLDARNLMLEPTTLIWHSFAANICPPVFSLHEPKNIKDQIAMMSNSSATRDLRALHTTVIFVLRAIHVSAII